MWYYFFIVLKYYCITIGAPLIYNYVRYIVIGYTMQPDIYTIVNDDYVVASSLEELLSKLEWYRGELVVMSGCYMPTVSIVRGITIYIRYDLDLLEENIF